MGALLSPATCLLPRPTPSHLEVWWGPCAAPGRAALKATCWFPPATQGQDPSSLVGAVQLHQGRGVGTVRRWPGSVKGTCPLVLPSEKLEALTSGGRGWVPSRRKCGHPDWFVLRPPLCASLPGARHPNSSWNQQLAHSRGPLWVLVQGGLGSNPSLSPPTRVSSGTNNCLALPPGCVTGVRMAATSWQGRPHGCGAYALRAPAQGNLAPKGPYSGGPYLRGSMLGGEPCLGGTPLRSVHPREVRAPCSVLLSCAEARTFEGELTPSILGLPTMAEGLRGSWELAAGWQVVELRACIPWGLWRPHLPLSQAAPLAWAAPGPPQGFCPLLEAALPQASGRRGNTEPTGSPGCRGRTGAGAQQPGPPSTVPSSPFRAPTFS